MLGGACNHNVMLYHQVFWLERLTLWGPIHYAPCCIMCIPDAGVLPTLTEAQPKEQKPHSRLHSFGEALCTGHFAFNWEWSPVTAATNSSICHSVSLTDKSGPRWKCVQNVHFGEAFEMGKLKSVSYSSGFLACYKYQCLYIPLLPGVILFDWIVSH